MELIKKENLMQEHPFPSIYGQTEAIKKIRAALLVKRNIILVGPPGCGKTTLAKDIARLLAEIEVVDSEFHYAPDDPNFPPFLEKTDKTKTVKGSERFVRVQGSPDLTSEDLLGDIDPIKALKFGPLSIEAFSPGKIFRANNGVLFFDEVNRASEKLQNALLQALEERSATIGSYDVTLPTNFIFVGTMNPGDSSTEKLSDVFLDRFDLIYIDYPQKSETEREIVLAKGKKLDVAFDDKLVDHMITFVRNLRTSGKLEKKPSVRASIGLYENAQANAVLSGRSTVDMKDIEDAMHAVLAHRIELKPSLKYLESTDQFIEQEFGKFQEEYQDDFKGGDP